MLLSLIIPAKNREDQKLKDLLESIDKQSFPKDKLEVLVITEGTSESAKAIGIRKASGNVIGILASDNDFTDEHFLAQAYENATRNGATYPIRYHYDKKDDALNRYFALIGGNDPLNFYMKKNDRKSYLSDYFNFEGSIGDNGFFIKKKLIEPTDLDNYYHIDNAIEAKVLPWPFESTIWHKTGGNLFQFLLKRYKYGLQHAFNPNRRWHMVDFSKQKDIWRLTCFIILSLTLLEPLLLACRGYLRIKDRAWFLHPVVCIATLIIYAILTIHLGIRRMFQSLSAPLAVRAV